jgi:hypothetical protein
MQPQLTVDAFLVAVMEPPTRSAQSENAYLHASIVAKLTRQDYRW